MEYILHFAYPFLLFLLLPLVIVVAIARLKWRRQVIYHYSLGSEFVAQPFIRRRNHTFIFFILRFLMLLLLAILIARPQLVDPRSNVFVEGIDMMLVLDVSGSMQFSDDGDKNRSRVEIAKQEAIRFIEKRVHDPLGLVIFGKDAISRCPITTDKNILTSIVKDLAIGVIDPDGTALSLAILTAANRLKDSKSKSKIMIVLTDGEPSPWDERPEVAIEVAKRMGIKIYTVGIGTDKDEAFMMPMYGLVQKPKINRQLLTKIAKETGGNFFLAQNQQDMRTIYDTINRLEKTEYKADLFGQYQDLFMPFLLIILLFALLEVVFSSLIWFGL